MKTEEVCCRYFNGFHEIGNCRENDCQTLVLAVLKILSYITLIVPLFFGIAYGFYLLCRRVSESDTPSNQDQRMQAIVAKPLKKSHSEIKFGQNLSLNPDPDTSIEIHEEFHGNRGKVCESNRESVQDLSEPTKNHSGEKEKAELLARATVSAVHNSAQPAKYLDDVFEIASSLRELIFLDEAQFIALSAIPKLKLLTDDSAAITHYTKFAIFFISYDHNRAIELIKQAEARFAPYKDQADSKGAWIATSHQEIENAKRELGEAENYFETLQQLIKASSKKDLLASST